MATVRFVAAGRSWQTEAETGETVLEAARRCGAPEGDACGGVCACSTCHVYINQGQASLSAAEDNEEDALDKAFDVQLTSRLGCQATITGEGPIEVQITEESLDAFYNEHPKEVDPRSN